MRFTGKSWHLSRGQENIDSFIMSWDDDKKLLMKAQYTVKVIDARSTSIGESSFVCQASAPSLGILV